MLVGMKKKIIIGALCIVGFSAWYLFGFWSVIHKSAPKPGSDPYASKQAVVEKLVIDPNALYPVMRVIDGDTFVAKIDGQEVTVRVLGENAPETVKPKAPVECYGPEASEEDKFLLNGRSVHLEIDPTRTKSISTAGSWPMSIATTAYS